MLISSIFVPFYKFITFILELVIIGTYTPIILTLFIKKFDRFKDDFVYTNSNKNIGVHISVILPKNFVHAENKTIDADCILYFHCNHSKAKMQYFEIYKHNKIMFDSKVKTAWILFEYPGCDESGGKFTADSCCLFTQSALDYIKLKFNGKVVLIGHSLGTAVILKYIKYASINNNGGFYDGVVLICPFESLLKVCKGDVLYVKLNKYLPLDALIEMNFNFCGEKEILHIKNKEILIIDAEFENILPMDSGLKLYERLKEKFNDINRTETYFNLKFSHQDICYEIVVWQKIFKRFNLH